MSTDQSVEVVRQFVANYERKHRNLVKRKGKLDSYRERLHKGEGLNDEQRKAVEGYDGVSQNIAFVQEFLEHAKELIKGVESSISVRENLIEVEHEQHTLKFIRIHSVLIRLLNSLDAPMVRTAVIKASSENHLKLLDVIRNFVTAPLLSDWPGSSSTALGNAHDFLEHHPSLHSTASCIYDLVLGKNKPVPIPEGLCCSLKKHSFKEVRALCFRLLASPGVQRSMGMPSSQPSASVNEADECVTSEPSTTEALEDHKLISNDVKAETIESNKHPVESTEPAEDGTVQSVPKYLDHAIKPFATSYNFLQASNVISCKRELQFDPAVGFGEEDKLTPEIHSPNIGAEPISAVNQTVDVHLSESCHPELTDGDGSSEKLCIDGDDIVQSDTLPPVCETQPFPESDTVFGYTAPASPGKISYADLLRRPSTTNAVAVNTSNADAATKRDCNAGHVVPPTCITFEPAEPHHGSHFDQSTSGRPGPLRGNRTRGFFCSGRGNGGSHFQPGSTGSGNRRGGNMRGGRFDGRNQPGRGNGGYRGMRPSVAQATY